MHRPTYLPNLLSSLRIVLAPAMLGAAYSNAKAGFTLLLAVLLLTDALDGVLARAWQAETTLGRRLDRWGDGLTMSLGAAGVFFLWPAPVEQEWQWVIAALAGYLLIGLQRLLEPAEDARPTRWWCKVASWALPLSLVLWLDQVSAWPFRVAAVLQAVMGLGRFLGASLHRRQPSPPAAPLPAEPVPLAGPLRQG